MSRARIGSRFNSYAIKIIHWDNYGTETGPILKKKEIKGRDKEQHF